MVPFVVFILSFTATFLSRYLLGLEYKPLNILTIVYLILCMLFWMAGYLTIHFFFISYSSQTIKQTSFMENARVTRKIFQILLFLGVLGLILWIMDIITLKNIYLDVLQSLNTQIAKSQLAATGYRGSLLGFISKLLSSNILLLTSFYLLYYPILGSRNKDFAIFILFTLYIVEMISGGSRNGSIFCLVFLILTLLVIKYKQKQNIKLKSKFVKCLTVLLFSFIVFFSLFVFVQRSTLYGKTNTESLVLLEKENDLQLHIKDINFVKPIRYSLICIVYYISHPYNEIQNLLMQEPRIYPMHGLYNFTYIGLILNKFNLSINPLQLQKDNIERIGRYFGLFGSAYLDFGYLGGALSLFIFGTFSSYIGHLFRRRASIIGNFLYIYNLMFCLFAPFYSILGTANGFYILLSIIILIFFIMPKRKPRRL